MIIVGAAITIIIIMNRLGCGSYRCPLVGPHLTHQRLLRPFSVCIAVGPAHLRHGLPTVGADGFGEEVGGVKESGSWTSVDDAEEARFRGNLIYT